MRVIPIASDSMGTRSMATFVETCDLKVIIDPGVALGPRRNGLPPHPLEIEKMEEDWREIREYAARSDMVVITHYHYDHYNPAEIDILKGKNLFVKHPTENINLSQKKRAKYFLSKLQQEKVHVEYCDNKNFKKGSTEIIFSKAVFHGTSPRLGYVVEVFIKEGSQSFLFSSDVEGPSIKEQAEFILNCNPKITYIDGPMTYMLGYRYSGASLQASIKNLLKIVENTQVNTLILDHHLLRDLRWRDYMNEVSEACRQKGCEFLSAALYSGKEELMLEARRKILYEKFPVKK